MVRSKILLNGSIHILQLLRPPWVMQAGMGGGSLLLQGLGPARGSHREGPGALQTQPSISSEAPRPAPASSPTSLRPEGLEGLGSRSQSVSHHTLCCRDHTNTHTHIPILTSIRKISSPSPNPSHGSSWQIGLSKISPSSLPASQEFVFRKERTMLVFEPQTWPREGRRAFLPWAPQ